MALFIRLIPILMRNEGRLILLFNVRSRLVNFCIGGEALQTCRLRGFGPMILTDTGAIEFHCLVERQEDRPFAHVVGHHGGHVLRTVIS